MYRKRFQTLKFIEKKNKNKTKTKQNKTKKTFYNTIQ